MVTTRARVVTVLATVFVAVMAAFALAGCGSDSTAQSQESSKSASAPAVKGLKTSGVLTVGLRSSTGDPLVRRGTSSVDGLYVDVAGAMADQLGVTVRFVEVSNVEQALEDTVDVVMDVSADEVEDAQVVGDITESAVVLFRRKSSTDEKGSSKKSSSKEDSDEDDSNEKSSDDAAEDSKQDGDEDAAANDDEDASTSKSSAKSAPLSAKKLNGARVALQDGSAAQRVLQLSGVGVEEVGYESLNDAFSALYSGEADYVACNASSGAYLATRYDGIELAASLTEPRAMGMAVAKGSGEPQDALKAAFDKIEQGGVLGEVRRRWLGSFEHLDSNSLIRDLPSSVTEDEDANDPWSDFDFEDYSSENLGSATMDGSSAGANAATISSDE